MHLATAEVVGLQIHFLYNAVVEDRGNAADEELREPVSTHVLFEKGSGPSGRSRTSDGITALPLHIV